MRDRRLLPVGFRLSSASSNYTVLNHHGSGGTAVVYKAEDQRKRIFALKEFFDDQLMERDPQTTRMRIKPDRQRPFENVRDRWRAEFKTFAHHRIPGLVQIDDFIEANNTCYLVMRFVEGESLWDQVKARGPMDIASALKLIRSLGSTLGMLHTLNIIHRDVKPDNVWIQKDGNPMLLDAGAARNYTTGDVRRTRLQTMLGAPELLSTLAEQKYGRLGPASDVYALAGLFVYAITTRVPPRNVSDFAKAGTADDPIHKFAMPVNAASRKVLTKALDLYVCNRYPSASEFVTDLDSAIRSSASPSQPISEPGPIKTLSLKTGQWFTRQPKSERPSSSQVQYTQETVYHSVPTTLAVLAVNVAAVTLIFVLFPKSWNIAILLVCAYAHKVTIRRCQALSQQLGAEIDAQTYIPFLNFWHAKSLLTLLTRLSSRSQNQIGDRTPH